MSNEQQKISATVNTLEDYRVKAHPKTKFIVSEQLAFASCFFVYIVIDCSFYCFLMFHIQII